MEPATPLTVEVRVGDGYEVVVGSGLLMRAHEFIDHQQIALIVDSAIVDSYGAPLRELLEGAGRRVHLYPVASGERSKGFETLEHLLRAMVRDGFDRGAAVVALGGGVVGDLAGFCAASFLRGVALYQIPTTLLAMVDASVGGKTGINLPEGKNLVGAFWQPSGVIADVETLRSLDPSVMRQGAVEAYKHGLLADPSLWREVGAGAFSVEATSERLARLVAAAVRVKADVVASDTFERGVRAHLNLGHTLAHALETASHHGLAHGEAVGYGLLYAAHLARARGWTDLSAEVGSFLRWIDPAPLPPVGFDELLALMGRDKKRIDRRLRFVLLRDLADPLVVDDLDEAELRSAWTALREDLA
jgi:3-dehydroquinate synthase